MQKEKENKGVFGLFRKGSRKQSEQVSADIPYEKTAVITQERFFDSRESSKASAFLFTL